MRLWGGKKRRSRAYRDQSNVIAMTAGSAGSHVIVMNVSPALIWSFKSTNYQNPSKDCLSLYLDSQITAQSYFFHIFECIFDGSEWVSECDHSSVGENTPQTCHWPIWLHLHVASFGDSDCSSKDVVITTGTTKRHTFSEDWNFYLEVCISKRITQKGNKDALFISFSNEVWAIITPLQK